LREGSSSTNAADAGTHASFNKCCCHQGEGIGKTGREAGVGMGDYLVKPGTERSRF